MNFLRLKLEVQVEPTSTFECKTWRMLSVEMFNWSDHYLLPHSPTGCCFFMLPVHSYIHPAYTWLHWITNLNEPSPFLMDSSLRLQELPSRISLCGISAAAFVKNVIFLFTVSCKCTWNLCKILFIWIMIFLIQNTVHSLLKLFFINPHQKHQICYLLKSHSGTLCSRSFLVWWRSVASHRAAHSGPQHQAWKWEQEICMLKC